MSPRTLEKLKAVHPELRRRAEILLRQLAAQGLMIEVVQGLRTALEQNDLYAQGRTKPGKKVTNAKAWQSNHNYGLAIDFCPSVDGKLDWNAPAKVWRQVGSAAESLGLEWGGRWAKFPDLPHVQLPGLSVGQCYALFQRGGLALVWQRASAAIRAVEADFARAVTSSEFPKTLENAPQLPQVAPKVAAATQPAPASKTSKGGPVAPQIPAFPAIAPSGLSPRWAENVTPPVPSRAVESLKQGNTLPVALLSAILAARDFLAANRVYVFAALAVILLIVVWLEFRPQKGKAK